MPDHALNAFLSAWSLRRNRRFLGGRLLVLLFLNFHRRALNRLLLLLHSRLQIWTRRSFYRVCFFFFLSRTTSGEETRHYQNYRKFLHKHLSIMEPREHFRATAFTKNIVKAVTR